jgi:non-ribosomal peptide synthetase component F
MIKSTHQNLIDLDTRSVLHLFHQQVIRSPDAIALCDGKERLSYAALNEQANALACSLVAQNTVPNHLIALALPRGIDQIIAILAIMKCGAAYLPIDI